MFTILLTLLSWQLPAAASVPPTLVAERGASASFKGDLLDLRSGPGWLRFPDPILDFDIAFEIRAVTPEADAGLVVRTWIGREMWPERGYRLRIPTTAPADVSQLWDGRHEKVDVLQKGTLQLQPPGEWQRVRVVGRGARIQLTMNGVPAGEFQVASYGGFLMFDNRTGRVELRGIALATSGLNETIPADVMPLKELIAAGGKGPKVLQEVKPLYTPEAMRAIAQGVVTVDAVIMADGSVSATRVARSLRPDLDASAVAALKAWRFEPAVLDGKPVATLAQVEMSFRLK